MMKQVPEVAQYSLFPLQLTEALTSLVRQTEMLIQQINDLNQKNEEWRLKYNSLKTDYEAAIAEAGHFRGLIQNVHQLFDPEFRPSDAK